LAAVRHLEVRRRVFRRPLLLQLFCANQRQRRRGTVPVAHDTRRPDRRGAGRVQSAPGQQHGGGGGQLRRLPDRGRGAPIQLVLLVLPRHERVQRRARRAVAAGWPWRVQPVFGVQRARPVHSGRGRRSTDAPARLDVHALSAVRR